MGSDSLKPLSFVDAQIASGKTTQIARAAVRAAKEGETVVVAAPTHRACDEVDRFVIQNEKLGNGTLYVHLFGQRQETCLPEKYKKQTACSSCPIYEKWISGAGSKGSRETFQKELAGGAFDLKKLQDTAKKHDMCARVLSRVLATASSEAGIPTVVTLPHNYLFMAPANRILEAIAPVRIFVDEGDTLSDAMLSYNLIELKLAGFRSNRNGLHSRCAPLKDCLRCRLHYSDRLEGGRITPPRRLIGPAEAVSHPSNFIEPSRNAIEFVRDEIKDGLLKEGVFNLEGLEENLARLEELLGTYAPPPKGEPSWKTLAGIRNAAELKGTEGGWPWLKIVDLSSAGDPDEEEPEIAISIMWNRALTEAGRLEVSGENEEVLELEELDERPPHAYSRRIPLRAIVAEGQSTALYRSGTKAEELRRFLTYAEFCQAAGGTALLHTPPKVAETMDDGHRIHTWQSTCELSLLAFDEEGFKSAVDTLRSAETKLLSGTFLDPRLAAASFLLSEGEVRYQNLKGSFHNSCRILLHNPDQGKLLPDRAPRPLHIGGRDLIELVRNLSDRLPEADLKVLYFSTNTSEAAEFFQSISKDETLAWLHIENGALGPVQISSPSARERASEARAVLVIDKLRSPSARAANRQYFDICIVYGNGYPNRSRFAPIVLAAGKNAGTRITLREFVEYNRQRAVIQALLRVPRTAKPAVCLYVGDMPVWGFPEDLRTRIVTTGALFLKEEARFEALRTVDGQVGFIAEDISRFLLDGTAGSAASEIVSTIDPQFKYLADLWCEHRGLVHRNAHRYAGLRIEKILSTVRKRGWVDRTKDRFGDRSTWAMLLDFMVACGVLAPAPLNHGRGKGVCLIERPPQSAGSEGGTN